MPKQTSEHELLDYLKQNSNIIPKFCDTCGAKHTSDSLQVISSKNNAISCRIHCSNCGASHILNIAMPVGGVGVASRAPINVDLSSVEEFHKFAGKTAVSVDDAMDSYKALSDMRSVQDFLSVFDRRS